MDELQRGNFIMRAFFGIPCPETIRTRLAPLRDELSDGPNFKPVRTENFHMTVKFLGEISTGDQADFDSLLQSRLPTPGPLTMRVRTVGVFPNLDHPSVVWAGIEPTDPLREMYDTVESIARELGFDPDDHDFRPHVTLGRFKNSIDDKKHLLDWIKSHGEDELGTFEAAHLHLYESDLREDGPIYTSLVSWPL